MADYPIGELDNRTPLEAARTPFMDTIVKRGVIGRVKNIPDKVTPGSDVATISILGYDPIQYYTGRGPLEAANLGIEVGDNDVAFRCNLVTVAENRLVDYSAGHISSREAEQIIRSLDRRLKFYPGVSYRHVLLVKDGSQDGLEKVKTVPPHDIMGQDIKKLLPKGKNAEIILTLMSESRRVLDAHEINAVRIDLKENPANMIWLWGQGKKPSLPSFKDKYGLSGSVISAVDLIKGLGIYLGLEVINVPGATGYYDTNYEGKAIAALEALKKKDFVFVHVEAPDEAGHNGDLREKITAIERFDQLVVGTIVNAFKDRDDFRILVLPDHATPLSLRTHTADPVCFALCGKGIVPGEGSSFNEKEALRSSLAFDQGCSLMEYFVKVS